MAPADLPWQWCLTLRPDPVGSAALRVLRAPDALALQQALERSIEPRWREAFEEVLELEVSRPSSSGHDAAQVKVRTGVQRHALDPLVELLIQEMARLLDRQDETDGSEPATEGHWHFNHHPSSDRARPPMDVWVQGVVCGNAWAAELALKALGPLLPQG